ncbi:hypothetical protein OG453_44020 [Streptomyces sp. NBC_01381]|uniref:hypothetical protein n=1 Tax=Streptomyces sp. NBC_01381 TaxID=2903845 RepID=UPI0022595014|nr:hypothetical protein [Streptomyces sp. NBC_01381]MCX4673529.1 hypothetical protein [Streptomyces sp. NBC_01381]
MSGSPKFSFGRLGQLRQERQAQQRAERERRRREQAERRVARALSVARAAAQERCRALGRHRATVATSDSVDPVGLQAAVDEIAQVEAEVQSASDLDALAATAARLDRAEQRLVELDLAALEQRRTELATALDVLRAQLRRSGPDRSARFDPKGLSECCRLLTELETAAAGPADAASHDLARTARRTVRAHLRTVAQAAAAYEHAMRLASAGEVRLSQRVEELQADASTAGVLVPGLDALRRRVGELRSILDGGRPVEAAKALEEMEPQVDACETEVDDAIDRLATRREMLGLIVEKLPQFGYTAFPESLVESGAGGIGVAAARLDGAEVSVIVHGVGSDERISYLADEQVELSDAGQMLSSSDCDVLQRLAERLNEAVRSAGYEVDGLQWQGHTQPPTGTQVVAPRPSGRPQAQRFHRP